MNNSNMREIYKEHRNALMLCNDIDDFVEHFDDHESYVSFQETIEKLRHLLINVHFPREHGLERRIKAGDRPVSFHLPCSNDRHFGPINSLTHLDELISAAMNGALVSKKDIFDEARMAVNRIHRLIDQEERLCLPFANMAGNTATSKNTGVAS